MGSEREQHLTLLTDTLYHMFLDAILTDVILVVDGVSINCHRNVLAASSPYFRAMFTNPVKERDEREIRLHDVCGNTLTEVLHYMYTGNIALTNENAQDIFMAATLFEMTDLSGRCANHMIQEICVMNCVEIYLFALHYTCNKLAKFARSFILEHFSDIIEDNVAITSLDLHYFEDLLQNDGLSVDKEETVYQTILLWIKQNDKRVRHFPRLFGHVRLVLIDDEFLECVINTEPLVQKDPFCQSQIAMANLHRLRSQTETEPGVEEPIGVEVNTKPRHGMFTKRLLVYSGGAYGPDERSLTAFDPLQKKNYMAVKPHPTFDFKYKIDFFQLVTVADRDIYFLGGIFYDDHHFSDYGDAIRDVYHYNMKETKWDKMTSMGTSRCCFSACVYNRCIYVIGGKPKHPRGEPTDSVECYNTELDTWIPLSSVPIQIYSHSSTATSDAIFVFGGKDEEDMYLDTILRYDISHDTWSLVTTRLNKPRSLSSAFTYKTKIYIIGGVSLHENMLSTLIYDPERNTWTHGQDFPEERKFSASAFAEGNIYVCGGVRHFGVTGRRSRKVESRDLYKYDIEADTWTRLTTLVQYGNTESCTMAVLNTKYLQESDFISK